MMDFIGYIVRATSRGSAVGASRKMGWPAEDRFGRLFNSGRANKAPVLGARRYLLSLVELLARPVSDFVQLGVKAANFRVELVECGTSVGQIEAIPRFAAKTYAGGWLQCSRLRIRVNQLQIIGFFVLL